MLPEVGEKEVKSDEQPDGGTGPAEETDEQRAERERQEKERQAEEKRQAEADDAAEAERLAEQKQRDEDRAELEALRAENAELKAAVARAPRPKVGKTTDQESSEEKEPKQKARVSARWFGESAYDD